MACVVKLTGEGNVDLGIECQVTVTETLGRNSCRHFCYPLTDSCGREYAEKKMRKKQLKKYLVLFKVKTLDTCTCTAVAYNTNSIVVAGPRCFGAASVHIVKH